MITATFVNTNGTDLDAHSAVWSTGSGLKIQSNACAWPTGSGPGFATHSTAMASANHYAELTCGTTVSNSFYCVSVRNVSWGSSVDKYWIEIQAGNVNLYKKVGGINSPSIGDSGLVGGVSGDVFRLSANGSTLTVSKNGTTLFTTTDTDLTSGIYVGIGNQNTTGGGITSWSADVLAPPAAPNDPTDATVSLQTETTARITGVASLSGTTATAWELQSSSIGGVGAGDWAGTGSQASNVWDVTGGGTYRRIRAGAGGLWSGWYYEQIGYLNPVYGGGGPLYSGGGESGGGSVLAGLTISPSTVSRAQTGSTVQFTLSGLVSGLPVSPLPASWSVMSGSGSIDSNGLLTVGALSGPIVVRAIPSADTLQSITATVLQVTKDMDDTSIQTQSYKNGIYTAEFLFNSGPGRVKVTALYGGVSQERIFGPGTVVPVAWNLGIQSQEVRFSVIGLPAA